MVPRHVVLNIVFLRQDEVLIDVDVTHSNLYRLIFRYVNPSAHTVDAHIKITPMTVADVEQTSPVAFAPCDARHPQLVTVPGEGTTSTFVLNPGRWTISLKTAEKIYVVSAIFSFHAEQLLLDYSLVTIEMTGFPDSLP